MSSPRFDPVPDDVHTDTRAVRRDGTRWRVDRPSQAASVSAGRHLGHESGCFLSVVIPARNESAGLEQLVREILQALRPLGLGQQVGHAARLAGFEIVIVDDGSTDASAEVLTGLAGAIPELRPVLLAQNVGQSAAISAGLRVARGDWIAMLDADLQNDPADLATLWHALPGHDAVLGWRASRADVWSRRVVSRLANRVRNAVLGQAIVDTGCSLRLMRRDDALRIPWFRGVHRFLGPLLLRQGCRVAQVPVNHRPRVHGRSHYNLRNRSLGVVVDLLGVAWLMRRPVRYYLRESLPGPARSGAERGLLAVAPRSLGPVTSPVEEA